MNVVFFGTPDFVLPIPQALLETGSKVVAVVTNSDRPVGRKQILTPSPVKKWAQEHQIPALTPEMLDENFIRQLGGSNFKFDVGVLAAYGKILPQELIDVFPQGILVVHPSLLPAYRGASPVQAAIINGDKITGVSIIKMDEKMDHGPIVSQFKDEIKPDESAENLYARLFKMSAEVLVTLLPDWTEGKITPRKQDHTKATFCKLLKKEDGYINLKNPPSPEIFQRMLRAYHPWPGVWTRLRLGFGGQARIIKFLPEGKIQLEGKKPVSWEQFQKSYPEVKLIP